MTVGRYIDKLIANCVAVLQRVHPHILGNNFELIEQLSHPVPVPNMQHYGTVVSSQHIPIELG